MNKNSSLTVDIEGQRYTLKSSEWENLNCIQVNDTTYHLIEGGHTYEISIIDAEDSTKMISLRIDGENKKAMLLNDLDLLIERMGLNVARSKKLLTLNAPMPGLVTSVKVDVGQAVEEGTPLLILEAMKMENVITAPHQTIIKEIKVEVGQAIEKGAALVEFSEV